MGALVVVFAVVVRFVVVVVVVVVVVDVVVVIVVVVVVDVVVVFFAVLVLGTSAGNVAVFPKSKITDQSPIDPKPFVTVTFVGSDSVPMLSSASEVNFYC